MRNERVANIIGVVVNDNVKYEGRVLEDGLDYEAGIVLPVQLVKRESTRLL